MNSFDQSLKPRWQQQTKFNCPIKPNNNLLPSSSSSPNLVGAKTFPILDGDDLNISAVVPPVTVVLEGRSICQRINLHHHSSYNSLAVALRQMFSGEDSELSGEIDLTNAIPGHLVAYEDIENDLLLAGDLHWKDFVRVAKRIRILPIKRNSRKARGEP